jgi:S-adenosylmethionine-diacylglycerol 3-amino-3-carboxypropyl transferase
MEVSAHPPSQPRTFERGARHAPPPPAAVGPRSSAGAAGAHLADLAFRHAFKHLFVYNILFEDSEVDETYLELDERSRVLSITGAGCGTAGMLSARPFSIDAVDTNRHHLALAGLKMVAARSIKRHEEFYDLLGRGWQADPRASLGAFANRMPRWMQRYWARHEGRFSRGLYREGLTSAMLTAFRKFAGLDVEWLRWVMQLSVEERVKVVDEWIAPVLRSPLARAYFKSPAQLVALGINFEQRDRILLTEGQPDMAEFVLEYLRRLACTDMATNWFCWYAIAGHFDHARPDAVPPYLRADRHARSVAAPTELRFHHGDILGVLDRSAPKSFTHYTLCDAPDWMPPDVQRGLLERILRTSRDGAIVLHRSVEDEGMVERSGLTRRFALLEDRTAAATRLDRTRQYRAVRFYQVQH